MESETRSAWLSHLLSTEPADRPGAESALRAFYVEGGFSPPNYFFWFDSPFSAAWAEYLLSAPHDELVQQLLGSFSREKRGRELIQSVRADLCKRSRLDWEGLTAIAGEPISYYIHAHPSNRFKTILPAVWNAKRPLFAKFGDPGFDDSDDLHRAEKGVGAVLSGHASNYTSPTIEYPFCGRYSFSEMAWDESSSLQNKAAPILSAVWSVSRCAGRWWWPFLGCVILSDRPVEVHLNDRLLLHRTDGPALVYRDGTRVWAFNGTHVPEDWMLHPELIPKVYLRNYEPSLRKWVMDRVGTPVLKAKPKPSAILKKALPAPPAERIGLLRKHNQDRLPFFDRYAGGDYKKVWEDLIALGPSVREDPYAADALAVAYETMSRVDANVRTVTARLASLGYEFAERRPHEPPSPKTPKQIARLEKLAGVLPLSLRAFYDVVGGVNWAGQHSSVPLLEDMLSMDPLVVYAAGEALQALEEEGSDPETEETLVVIAPDETFKAGDAGGDAYVIAVPDSRADAPLVDEGHDLCFVEYLRLVFRFGGFPGYDGFEAVPAEIESLSQGLAPF